MTSGNINSFVGDLVEMAKAMETLPQVQAELDHAKLDQHNLSVEIDRLKADLEQSRNYAASLEQKVRTTEAERDDAELRFLELDEKAHKAMVVLGSIADNVKMSISVLSQPKPEPVSEPVQPPVPEVVQSIESQPSGQGVENPSVPSPAGDGNHTGDASTMIAEKQSGVALSPTSASQDQSDANPTTAQALVENSSMSASSPDASDNGPMVVQETPTQPDDGKAAQAGSVERLPYAGLRYVDIRGYIPYHDWVAGGGSYASYWEGRST